MATGTSGGAPTLHIIGAGMAGLAAAVEGVRAGAAVRVYEAAGQAGGRCRSFHDTLLDRLIDNGNHLILGANRGVFDYLAAIGATDALTPLDPPSFAFHDARTGENWTIRPRDGFLPLWLLGTANRVPGTGAGDLADGLRLATAGPDHRVADRVDTAAPAFERFWQPASRAILNTDATEGSARLLWRALRETLLKGAAGSRPYLAKGGLSAALVDPALRYLEEHGATVRFNTRLRAVETVDGTAIALDFGDQRIGLGPDDAAVLAVPPEPARALLPGLDTPADMRPIVNLHFRLDGPAKLPGDAAFLGLVGTTAQWLFSRGDILSVTVSAATRLAPLSAEAIAAEIWPEVAAACGYPPHPMPPVRVIKEQRATIAQTPGNIRRRPPAASGIARLFLAGDWIDTGLPATIDGALRSGTDAVKLALSAGFGPSPR